MIVLFQGVISIALFATRTVPTNATLNSAPVDMGLMQATRVNVRTCCNNHVLSWTVFFVVALRISRPPGLTDTKNSGTNYVVNSRTL